MSVVCILTPVVVASWPAFSSAVAAAAVSMGYAVAERAADISAGITNSTSTSVRTVTLDIEQSEIVTGQLGRDKTMTIVRQGVRVTFSRDPRGKASVCVEGEGMSDGELRTLGEEVSGRVVQQYVYRRLLDEMRLRDFMVVEDEVEQDRSIRIKVRRWES